jgi:hypothetical protein
MTAEKFLANVREIVASNPRYKTGGSGKNGVCDCIGLVIGAMGSKPQLHSTNYYARHQMASLEPVGSVELSPGFLVYKVRADTGQLNQRYKTGGTHHAGDARDWYHVGVVTSVDPLIITHCTSGGGVDGITHDYSLSGWQYAGRLKGIEYDTKKDEMPMEKATIYADNGKPVRLRKDPSTDNPYLEKVAVGTAVNVLETAIADDSREWSKIDVAGRVGYVMTKYLKKEEKAENDPLQAEAGAFESVPLLEEINSKLDTILELLGGGAVG